MKVCYFGIYSPTYSRNKILISGLRQNGVEVLECRSNKKGVAKYFDLMQKHWQIRNAYDVMVVGFPGFQAVILAKLITRKPVILDAFLSMYDSMVSDRKSVLRNSLRARYFWWLDKIAMSLADRVLIDTNEHKRYLSQEFGITAEKIKRIFVGADTDVFYPRESVANTGVFRVLFYGTYIPLHGIEYIIRAAKILEKDPSIKFRLVGDGQEKKKILLFSEQLKIRNIDFVSNVPLVDLSDMVLSSDICLGIFGNTEKATRVIANKVYEVVAMAHPIITGDSLALRELFTPDEICMVPMSSPEAIADAIVGIKANREQALIIAKRGYQKLITTASVGALGLELKNITISLIQPQGV